MGNVIELAYKRTPAFPQESSLYFPVYEVPLAMLGKQNFHRVTGHKALARAGVNDEPLLLAIVQDTYKTVQNKELFQAVEAQFEAGLGGSAAHELNGVQVKDKMSYDGAVCLREYVFPNMRCDININSTVAFRCIVVNGFGGSAVKLYVGAIDFFCTNGMVRGQFDHAVKRHTKNLEISGLADRVRRSIDVFYKDADMYKQWAGRMLSADDVEYFFTHSGLSERLQEKLKRQYLIETQSHSNTVWALYSAMTYYATHDEGEFALRKTDNNHAASTLLRREESVMKLIASPAWNNVVAA